MNRPYVALEVLERARMVVAMVASVKDRNVALLAFSLQTGRHASRAVIRFYSHLPVTPLAARESAFLL